MIRNNPLSLRNNPTFLINEPNWLGDVLFSIPVLLSVKQAHPQARLIVLAPQYLEALFRMVPQVDGVITMHRIKPSWHEVRTLFSRIRSYRPDAALMLQGSSTRALLFRWAGVPIVIGRKRRKKTWGLTHVVVADSLAHRRDEYAALLSPLGIPLNITRYQLCVPEAIERMHRDHFSRCYGLRPKHYLVFHPGGNWDRKRWPIERFVALARESEARHWPPVVLIGTAREKALAESIKRSTHCVINLCGETSLEQLAVLLKNASVMVSGDSGPLHMAAALGTPVIGLYGPTHPHQTGPIGSSIACVLFHDVGCNRAACYDPTCVVPQCLHAVSVASVIEAMEQVLQSGRNPHNAIV